MNLKELENELSKMRLEGAQDNTEIHIEGGYEETKKPKWIDCHFLKKDDRLRFENLVYLYFNLGEFLE